MSISILQNYKLKKRQKIKNVIKEQKNCRKERIKVRIRERNEKTYIYLGAKSAVKR